MITISVRKADFDEIDAYGISKAPIVESLKVFWQKNESKFYEFLKRYGIAYKQEFDSLNEMMDYANSVIEKIIELSNDTENIDMANFDYRAISYFNAKTLKITEFDFIKLTLDLKEIQNDKIKKEIKNLAILTPSIAFIECPDVSDNTFELIYSKKGAFYYNDEPFLCNSRSKLTLLENFQTPRENNFIMARFLLDLSKKLKENGIDETFCVNYSPTNQTIKTIDEIIECATLSPKEKKAFVESKKEKIALESLAKEQAKDELKDENNARRNSLNQKESKEVLENAKSSNVVINDELNEADNAEFDRLFSPVATDSKQETINEIYKKFQTKIADIVERSIKLYDEKELQKFNMRLEKAHKDKEKAYEDLKKYLDNGLSILEAIQNIKQKYSEDTVHLASLLFSQDILNVKSKDEIIAKLDTNNKNLQNECQNLNEKLDKKDETISSLRSTMQKKVNEIQNLEYELREEFKKETKEREQKTLEMVEAYKAEQNKLITQIKENAESEKNDIIAQYKDELDELGKENNELNDENNALVKENDNLKQTNQTMEAALKNTEQQLETLKKSLETSNKELYAIQTKEEMYKTQIEKLETQLKEQNNILKTAISNNNSAKEFETDKNFESDKSKQPKRVKDILGPAE